jgi:hypothetical protein
LPVFGDTQRQAPAPPLSGGTLTVLSARRMAVVADPDRDAMSSTRCREGFPSIALQAGDEPGRVAHDGDHLASSRCAAVARRTIDVATATILSRRAVVSAPRGLAYEPTARVRPRRAGGESSRCLPRTARRPVRSTSRLICATSSSRRRRALRQPSHRRGAVDRPGRHHRPGRRAPADTVTPFTQAAIAWRMIPRPGGDDPPVVHQRARAQIDNKSVGGRAPAYYSGNDCFPAARDPGGRDLGDGFREPGVLIPCRAPRCPSISR